MGVIIVLDTFNQQQVNEDILSIMAVFRLRCTLGT